MARGTILVVGQFGLLGLLGALALRPSLWPDPVAAVPLAAGVVLGLWALSVNRPGNFNIRPVPRAGAIFVRRGPYRWIRHPMYSALLLAGLGAVRMASAAGDAWAGPAGWSVWCALLAVLWAKSGLEERALVQQFNGYANYRDRSGRFLPRL